MTIGLGAFGMLVAWWLGFSWMPGRAYLSGAQRAGFAYGLGLVWISTMMGVLAVLGVPVTRMVGVVSIVGPPLGWWLWQTWRLRRGAEREGSVGVIRPVLSRDPWWWGLAALLGVLCAIVVVRATVKPMYFRDGWATYALKAKIIYLEASVPRAIFDWVVAPNYPLGVPFQEVWVAWFAGSWDDVAVKLLFPGYALALLCLVYGTLRDRWGARAAMGGTLFVAGLPFLLQHAQDAYTDLPLAYFVLGNAVALTRYALSSDRRDLVLASVFAAGLVWTREDGLIVVAANALLLAALGARRGGLTSKTSVTAVGIYLAFPALVWGAWTLAKLHMGISTNLHVDSSDVMGLDRWQTIFEVFVRALFLQGNWMILWALFSLVFVYEFRNTLTEESMFLVWPVVTYLVVIGVLVFMSELFRFLWGDTVLHRLILHVAPLAALWVALTCGRWWGLAEPSPDVRGEG